MKRIMFIFYKEITVLRFSIFNRKFFISDDKNYNVLFNIISPIFCLDVSAALVYCDATFWVRCIICQSSFWAFPLPFIVPSYSSSRLTWWSSVQEILTQCQRGLFWGCGCWWNKDKDINNIDIYVSWVSSSESERASAQHRIVVIVWYRFIF